MGTCSGYSVVSGAKVSVQPPMPMSAGRPRSCVRGRHRDAVHELDIVRLAVIPIGRFQHLVEGQARHEGERAVIVADVGAGGEEGGNALGGRAVAQDGAGEPAEQPGQVVHRAHGHRNRVCARGAGNKVETAAHRVVADGCRRPRRAAAALRGWRSGWPWPQPQGCPPPTG